ncbi:MAG: GTPase [Acetobacteraceae bacterium]
MRLRVFHGRTTAQALAQARQALGEDALILATRRTAGGVEVTAATEANDDLPSPAPTRDDPAPFVCRWDPAVPRAHGVPDRCIAHLARSPGLAEGLARMLAFEPLPLAPGRVLLLCGPPGAGKTLTTAKLATRLRLQGTAPAVIAADGRRAGAVDQLAAYTRLLGLNLIVAPDIARLAKAIARRPLDAPTLVDLAGTDPFSDQDGIELAALIEAVGADAVLVLPAGLDPGESAETAEAMARRGVRHLLPTRLDLARRLGGVIAAAAAGLAIAEGGTGPGAADGLVPLDPATLETWLLAPPAARRPAPTEVAA